MQAWFKEQFDELQNASRRQVTNVQAIAQQERQARENIEETKALAPEEDGEEPSAFASNIEGAQAAAAAKNKEDTMKEVRKEAEKKDSAEVLNIEG